MHADFGGVYLSPTTSHMRSLQAAHDCVVAYATLL